MIKFTFDLDLGSLPDWIQAIASSIAFIIAVITLLDQKKQIRDLRLKDEKRKEQEDKYQANLVSVWADEWGNCKIKGICKNLSNEPIYSVTVFFEHHKSLTKKDVFLIRPQEELEFELDCETENISFPKIGIKFRDASGRYWIRDVDGKISPVPEK